MKKALIGIITIGLFASLAHASCPLVNDETGLITNPAQVEKAASTLLQQDADVHVIAANKGNPVDVEKAYEQRCGWLTGSGSRNANLFVLVISLNPGRKEMFYGSAYRAIFEGNDRATHAYSTANPFFHQHKIGEGFSAALREFGGVVVAAHDQAQHPVVRQHTTVINQQPNTAAAHVWGWIIGLLALGAAIFGVIWFLRTRKGDKEAVKSAQQGAIAAQTKATKLFRLADNTHPDYEAIAAQYAALSNSETNNPFSTGLSASSYRSIAESWNGLSADIRALSSFEPDPPTSRYTQPSQPSRSSYTPSTPSEPTPVSWKNTPPQQPTVIHETTYYDNSRYDSSGNLLTGILVGEAISNNNREYERPRYDEPRYTPEPTREAPSRRDDDDDNSGSSGFDSSSNDNNDDNSGSSGFDSNDSGGSSDDSSF